jgi:hypothetical protein
MLSVKGSVGTGVLTNAGRSYAEARRVRTGPRDPATGPSPLTTPRGAPRLRRTVVAATDRFADRTRATAGGSTGVG